jgi:hypothetical protein
MDALSAWWLHRDASIGPSTPAVARSHAGPRSRRGRSQAGMPQHPTAHRLERRVPSHRIRPFPLWIACTTGGVELEVGGVARGAASMCTCPLLPAPAHEVPRWAHQVGDGVRRRLMASRSTSSTSLSRRSGSRQRSFHHGQPAVLRSRAGDDSVVRRAEPLEGDHRRSALARSASRRFLTCLRTRIAPMGDRPRHPTTSGQGRDAGDSRGPDSSEP